MTIEPSVWGWPQFTMLGLMVLCLAIHMTLNGRPRTDNYNAGMQAAGFVLNFLILWAGGFWS